MGLNICFYADLTLLHSEWPKLCGVLAILSAIESTEMIPNSNTFKNIMQLLIGSFRNLKPFCNISSHWLTTEFTLLKTLVVYAK